MQAEPEGKSDDVANLYRLFLGREPESEQVARQASFAPLAETMRTFVASPEFHHRLVEPVFQGRAPSLEDRGPPPPALVDWTAAAFALSRDAARRLKSRSGSWLDLYRALFSEPRVRTRLGTDNPFRDAEALRKLGAEQLVRGVVEGFDGVRVRGWAALAGEGEGPIGLEVWINGVAVAFGVPTTFRRDVQEQFGGDGASGFEIAVPPGVDRDEGRMEIEVRQVGTGAVIGRIDAAPPEAALAEATALRAGIEDLRQALETLERGLPRVEEDMAWPVEAYPAYRKAIYGDGRAAAMRRDSPLRAVVLLDAVGAPPERIEEAVWSVADQTHAHTGLVLRLSPADAERAADLRARLRWGAGLELALDIDDGTAVGDWVRRREAGLDPAIDVVIVSGASQTFDPFAVAHLVAALEGPGVQAAYADGDAFDPTDTASDFRERRRIDPRFRPGFDPDLLLQIPYADDVLAVRRPALARPEVVARLTQDDGPLGARMLLGFLDAPEAVAHVPRVLTTAWTTGEAATGEGWERQVSSVLERREPAARVSAHADVLGAVVPGALSLHREPPRDATATVVIPTRDSLDLLRPCLESLFANRASNRVQMDVLVIDHESREPETRAFLDGLAESGQARVRSFEGVFNWALMNNLAAAESSADVLIFLNNDTVVLTPRWLDELVAQACRPEVGVVGCRLIYGDGTLQHAGFVARESPDRFLVHEGVGRPGFDPGYLGRHALVRSCIAVTGACMAVRADVFRDLGGFDAARLPTDGNDVDLCLRARAAGLRVLYTPNATLHHLESKTRGYRPDPERRRVAEAAAEVLWRRWGEGFGHDSGFNPHFDRRRAPFSALRPLGPL